MVIALYTKFANSWARQIKNKIAF